jgi:hypothetical protein
MTKVELAERIKRRLGCPMVNVELDISQIFDEIDYSRDKWIKWAVGQATQEVYFTIPISAGQFLYDMPLGVVEVIGYETDVSGLYSTNTLFTIGNYLYNAGLLDAIISTMGDGYTLVSYHIALDFLENLKTYSPDMFNFKYHPYTNQLEIRPVPTASMFSLGSISNYLGYLLVRSYMVQESSISDDWDSDTTYKKFYEYSDWILDYATARCKVMLGMIRRKFANFNGLGNVGTALDGDTLVSEGKEEISDLEERLRLEESYDGYGIVMG